MLKERLSYSLASKLLTKPIARVAYEVLNPSHSSTPIMARGQRFESVLHDGSTDQLMVWTSTKTRGVKFDNWAKENNYNPALCCTEEEYQETCAFLASMDQQGVCDLVRGMRYQEHLEYPDFHAYLDFSDDNTIYEMKVTSKPNDWAKHVLNMNYDIQAYIASMSGREFYWIVVDDEAPYSAFIGEPHVNFLQSGREKYEKAKKLFKELNDYDGLKPVQTKRIEPPYWLKLSTDKE